ncbi:MAG: hypothetical protein U1E96_06175 [Azonexus sp.]
MSLTASFYLVLATDCEELIAAAQAQSIALTKKRWGIFRPKLPLNPDPFWAFVGAKTRELDEFPYKGGLLLDVELMAPGALSSEDSVGVRLCEITKSTFISYRPTRANEVIQLLIGTDFSDSAIKDHLRREGRDSDIPEFIEPIRDASSRLKDWLMKVTGEDIGLLSVG